MPAKWDDASEKQLLLALLHLHPPQRASFAQIATMMGPDYTFEAVRQKYGKIKKTATETWGEVEIEEKIPKKKANGESAKSGGSKRKAKKEIDAGADEESPSKKVKVDAQEDQDGEDDEV